ncbi:eukaryotic aspartyl protease [Xylariaceae sp. FL0594]|nr:eukaryotic aspartyl protease [Xylariaceae sp. FL0594]
MCFRLLLLFICLLVTARPGSTLSVKGRSSHYVKLPVVHSTNRRVFSKAYQDKRAISTVSLAKRSDVAYYAELSVGTPPQQVFVQLDTGSFELWVNPSCSALQGPADVRFCQAVGQYDPSSSTSAVLLSTGKTLNYGIGSADIRYVKDHIGLAGTDTVLTNVQFGVATDTVDEFAGILGIGHGVNVTIRYRNMIDQLADQGVTKTKAFSLALGSKDEQEGVVVFGGLDTSKFTGPLQTQPIIPANRAPDGVPRYWINMESLTLVPPGGKDKKQYTNGTMAVFLDSGATLTLLPTALADAIAADFGAGAVSNDGFYSVDCDLNNQAGMLDFAFEGVTIHVPYREIVREVQAGFGMQCFLGIAPSDDFVLLGDTMLRSAYAVFDQTNNVIHLAQYANCGSKEVEITADMDFGSIQGDCSEPDLLSPAGTNSSNSTSKPTGTNDDNGAGETDSSTPNSAAMMRLGLGGWVVIWTLLCVASL